VIAPGTAHLPGAVRGPVMSLPLLAPAGCPSSAPPSSSAQPCCSFEQAPPPAHRWCPEGVQGSRGLRQKGVGACYSLEAHGGPETSLGTFGVPGEGQRGRRCENSRGGGRRAGDSRGGGSQGGASRGNSIWEMEAVHLDNEMLDTPLSVGADVGTSGEEQGRGKRQTVGSLWDTPRSGAGTGEGGGVLWGRGTGGGKCSNAGEGTTVRRRRGHIRVQG